jgi:hypothetical protein
MGQSVYTNGPGAVRNTQLQINELQVKGSVVTIITGAQIAKTVRAL